MNQALHGTDVAKGWNGCGKVARMWQGGMDGTKSPYCYCHLITALRIKLKLGSF